MFSRVASFSVCDWLVQVAEEFHDAAFAAGTGTTRPITTRVSEPSARQVRLRPLHNVQDVQPLNAQRRPRLSAVRRQVQPPHSSDLVHTECGE